MCNSEPLVSSRQKVCMGLGLLPSELVDIDRDRDKNAGTHGYLTMALNLWISKYSESTIEKLVQVLRAQELKSTADEISRRHTEFPPNVTVNLDQTSSTFCFDVPEDVHMFTGRVEDLKKLHESIIAQNLEDGKNDMTVITAVCGMGGVGKTSLTIRYAWAFFKLYFYMNVIWINSETKNTIADSFDRLARKLGQNISLQICDIVSGIYENFGKAKTLIVFDNVECYEDVKSYIPVRSPNAIRPYVLLSSRNHNWHFRTHLIDLDVFRTEESVEFFESYLCLSTEEELEQAKIISDALQNLPLAIRQAGAYIKMQQKNNRKPTVECMGLYFDLFKSNSIEVLNFNHSPLTAENYEKTIFSTWTVSMEKLIQENRLTRTIVELISYLNSDNIPIKLFYNIPQRLQGGVLNKLYGRSKVQITEVNSAVKLLADFSLIRQDYDLEFISVHRLLQKVVRTQTQQKYKDSRLDCVIDLIEIPLRLNNHDHYVDICLLHSLFIKEHIPPHLLHTKRIQSFFELVESKQNNSVNNNLKLLQEYLEDGNLDNALQSYEQSKKLYLAHETKMKVSIDQLFTLRFVILICLQIERDWNLSGINTGALELCELVKNVLSGCNISFDHEETIKYSEILRRTVVKLYERVLPSADLKSRNETLSIVYFILANIFCNVETNGHIFEKTCCAMFDCLIEVKAFEEIKRFLDRLGILLDRILSKKLDSNPLGIVLNVLEQCFRKLRVSDLLSAHPELFVPLPILQSRIYNYKKDKTDSLNMLLCGSSVMECKLEMDGKSLTLEAPTDIQRVYLSFVKSAGYQDFVNRRNNDDLTLVDRIHKVSQIPKYGNINNELTVIALDMYNLSLFGRRLNNYDEVWYRIASSMLECYTQTDKICATPIITAVQYSLDSLDTSTFENNVTVSDFLKFADDILRYAEGHESETPNHVLFQESINYIRFIYGVTVHMPYVAKCTEMTSKLISYLSAQKNYEDIISLVEDHGTYLENVLPRDDVAHPANVLLGDEIMLLLKHTEDTEHEKQLSLLAYSIYNRVYTFNSTIHESKISIHLNFSKGNEQANVLYCLAKVKKLYELFNFLMACENFLKENHHKNGIQRDHEIKQIIQISKHPNCKEIRDALIQKALSIFEIGHCKLYYSVSTVSIIIDRLAELEKVDEIMAFIRPIETFMKANDCPLQPLIEIAKVIYIIAQYEFLNRHNRGELLRMSLVFHTKYFHLFIQNIQISKDNNYDLLRKNHDSHPSRYHNEKDYTLIIQGADGIINCLVELNRSGEIVESIKKIVNVFQDYFDTNPELLQRKGTTSIAFSRIIEKLLSIGIDFSNLSTNKEFIQLSLDLCMIKYKFEKRTLSFGRILSTVWIIVECFIRLNKIGDILVLSVEFENIVTRHFASHMDAKIKKMAGLSEILMRKGRDASHLIKHPDLIKRSLAISRKWYKISVRENGDTDYLSLIHFHCITICEHLFEPNVNKLLQYSKNLYTIAEGRKHNPYHWLVLVQAAIELRRAKQIDKAVEYFRCSNKILSEDGISVLNDRKKSFDDIDELDRMVRDDDSYQTMIYGLTFYTGGGTSESISESDYDSN